MTVSDLLLKLGMAFALFRPAGEAWAPVFRARLESHEGAALQQAFVQTLAGFRPGPRQAFPLPADFEANLPSRAARLPRGEGARRLDFAARNARAGALMAEWQSAQGDRAAQGVAELAGALADIAWPLARQAAWRPEAPALRLSRGQVRLAHHRALSQQRLREHRTLPRDAESWRRQVDAIAARWGLPGALVGALDGAGPNSPSTEGYHAGEPA